MRTAGPLRHRVTLQKPVEAEEATYGDIGETWTDAVGYTVPAFIRPMKSRERVEAQAVGNLATRLITYTCDSAMTSHPIGGWSGMITALTGC
jgi:SPP1 family predicted phage head-tail adaptor